LIAVPHDPFFREIHASAIRPVPSPDDRIWFLPFVGGNFEFPGFEIGHESRSCRALDRMFHPIGGKREKKSAVSRCRELSVVD